MCEMEKMARLPIMCMIVGARRFFSISKAAAKRTPPTNCTTGMPEEAR